MAHKGTGPPRRPASRASGRSELDAEEPRPRRATGRPAVAASSRARSAAGVSRSSSSAVAAPRLERRPSPRVAGARRRQAPRPLGRRPRQSASPSPLPVVRGSGGRAGPGGRPAGSHSFNRSPTKTRLPSDFDIFVPSRPTIPTCIQWRHEGLPGHRLGLGRLALVVGEDRGRGRPPWRSIGLAELAQGQRRALDVPAGPARAPARLPGRLVGQRRLPQHEVERVALVGVVGVAAALGRQRAASRSRRRWLTCPNAVEGGHVEVDRPARLVGVAAVEDGIR